MPGSCHHQLARLTPSSCPHQLSRLTSSSCLWLLFLFLTAPGLAQAASGGPCSLVFIFIHKGTNAKLS